jgi:hypothetical protein
VVKNIKQNNMAVTGLDKVFVVNAETNTKYGGVDSTGEFVTINDLVQQSYKVYTALITQSGKGLPASLFEGDPLTVGVTYIIMDDGGGKNCDFTNVGAPNNNFGTYFVATGTDPNSWGGNTYLEYNDGAPVVRVLENTIGNIWWTQQGRGSYWANSDNLFTRDKTLAFISQSTASEMAVPVTAYTYAFGRSSVEIETYDSANTPSDGVLTNTPIEIRVYNE